MGGWFETRVPECHSSQLQGTGHHQCRQRKPCCRLYSPTLQPWDWSQWHQICQTDMLHKLPSAEGKATKSRELPIMNLVYIPKRQWHRCWFQKTLLLSVQGLPMFFANDSSNCLESVCNLRGSKVMKTWLLLCKILQPRRREEQSILLLTVWDQVSKLCGILW